MNGPVIIAHISINRARNTTKSIIVIFTGVMAVEERAQ